MTNRFRPSGYPAVFTPIWVNKIKTQLSTELAMDFVEIIVFFFELAKFAVSLQSQHT